MRSRELLAYIGWTIFWAVLAVLALLAAGCGTGAAIERIEAQRPLEAILRANAEDDRQALAEEWQLSADRELRDRLEAAAADGLTVEEAIAEAQTYRDDLLAAAETIQGSAQLEADVAAELEQLRDEALRILRALDSGRGVLRGIGTRAGELAGRYQALRGKPAPTGEGD